MRNAWKIVVVVLLVAAVAAVMGLKDRELPPESLPTVQEAAVTEPAAPPPPVASGIEEPEKSVEELSPVPAPAVSARTEETAKVSVKEVPAKPAVQQNEPSKPVQVAKQESPPKLPKLLDLGADKCVPCKMMAPILEELEKEYAGKLEVVFIDVWQDRDAAKEYKVQSIPTQIFYDAEGRELFRHVGFYSKEDILAAFKKHGIQLD